eukprot:TRINITY_DN21949_c0_g1_i2.p1 TRINITY_DN21949_c0_g1~~TRINITY_DN21949_c0_g1_i2.p1  ORF type:complete len:530 (+),score=40.45 TRINITY_DN21949_c0_g1_i2:206-1591(+)
MPMGAEAAVCQFLKSQHLVAPALHGCEKLPQAEAAKKASASPQHSRPAPIAPGQLKPAVARMQRVLWAREMRNPGPGQSHLLKSGERAVCHPNGVCDCLVPYRGPMCRAEDESDADRKRYYRGAIHYIVNEGKEHLAELFYSLTSLYEQFNARMDYPVLIFHDGLTTETRERIVLQAPHRIWFFQVTDWLPAEVESGQELHSTFALGYMAQSRFRSGPVFTHPATKSFDYLWTLDSDSHFPGMIESDPFKELHSNPDFVMGYSYITMTSPASVRSLWEHTMLYAMREGVDIWTKRLITNWRAGQVHFMSWFLRSSVEGYDRYPHWNNNVLMTDCEILRLSFFRDKGSRYWDYFSYLDSVHGFWSYRWGDHAVRTLGVSMALWEEDRMTWAEGRVGRGSDGWPRIFQMSVPYAHQDYCTCDLDEDPPVSCEVIHDPKAGVVHPELSAVLRKKYWRCKNSMAR